MLSTEPNQLTPREHAILETETEEARLSREHAVRIRELDLAIQQDFNQANIELEKLRLKWRSLLRLPVFIIMLPFFILLGLAYVCSMFTKKEMPKRFWDLVS